MDIFHLFDLLGVAVFAISGTLIAHDKLMDGLGVVVLASATAIGGGTVRDMILDVPVFWVADTSYFITIIATAVLTILWLNCRKQFPHSALQIADAFGLAFFAMMGAQKAYELGIPDLTVVVMAVLTGCFGGVIRDVLAREVPMLLKGPLYATTCIVGAIVFSQLANIGLDTQYAMACGGIITLLLRLAAIRWKLELHVFRFSNE